MSVELGRDLYLHTCGSGCRLISQREQTCMVEQDRLPSLHIFRDTLALNVVGAT